MFKIKRTIVTPLSMLWTVLLFVIVFMVASKPAPVVSEPVKVQKEVSGLFNDEVLTYNDMKSYQLEISPCMKYVIMYDYNRVVAVLPLDNHCNLTLAIERDND